MPTPGMTAAGTRGRLHMLHIEINLLCKPMARVVPECTTRATRIFDVSREVLILVFQDAWDSKV